MPAPDTVWRNLKTVHVVFALSCIAMFATSIWMVANDHIAEWRRHQSTFTRIEAERLGKQEGALRQKNQADIESLQQQLKEAEQKLAENRPAVEKARRTVRDWELRVDIAQRDVRVRRAVRDKARADYDLAVRDERPSAEQQRLLSEFEEAQSTVDRVQQDLDQKQERLDEAHHELAKLTQTQTKVGEELKQARADIDRLNDSLSKLAPLSAVGPNQSWSDKLAAALVAAKREIMTWPIIDGFNSPQKIEQDWLPDLKIKLGMAEGDRYDRCRTCHQAIDRVEAGNVAAFPYGHTESGSVAEWVAENKFPHPYATHPRPELYVTAASPHPASPSSGTTPFGCTICHAGQGSGVDFTNASHSPNDPHQRELWADTYGYKANHFWEYPMHPKRFMESSCLRCHHSVVELGVNRQFGPSAPKLYRGYQLITQYGCFGCHQIPGFSGEQEIGPDLRLEPNYSAAAQQLLTDPRLQAVRPESSEPSNEQAANDTGAGVLPEMRSLVEHITNHPGKSEAEENRLQELMRSVLPFLRKSAQQVVSQPASSALERDRLRQLLAADATLRDKAVLSRPSHDLAEVFKDVAHPGRLRKVGPGLRHVASKTSREWIEYWVEEPKRFRPDTRMPQFFHLTNQQDATAQGFMPVEIAGIAQYLFDASQPLELDQPADGYQPNADRGKHLFSQRGCLACHSHETFPETHANFGPNLTQVHAKIKPGAEGFRWLYTWLREPTRHHPRTRMPDLFLDPYPETVQQDGKPVTQTVDPAADIAAFLLQPGPAKYKPLPVDEDALHKLVDLNLSASLSRVQRYGDKEQGIQGFYETRTYPVPIKQLKGDEVELAAADLDGNGTVDDAEWQQARLRYVGRRTISRYGCYGCHDIPGFETARPIGTTLQDWGRKDTTKLAFEHIEEYLNHHGELYFGIRPDSTADGPGVLISNILSASPARRAGLEVGDRIVRLGPDVRLAKYDVHNLGELEQAVRRYPPDSEVEILVQRAGESEPITLTLNLDTSTRDRVTRTMLAVDAGGAEAGQFDDQAEQNRELSAAFFYHSLLHHDRPGFIWQKLRRPRSYDFEKTETKRYDERLRMPKFPVTEDEIEAIATFVLGLIAEPPAEQYVYHPQGPAAAIVEGDRLLEKFNCVGCHMIELPEVKFAADPQTLAAFAGPQSSEHPDGYDLLLKLKPPQPADTGETRTVEIFGEKQTLPVVRFHGLLMNRPDASLPPAERLYSYQLWETLEADGNVIPPQTPMSFPEPQLVDVKPARGGDFAAWLVNQLARSMHETPTTEDIALSWQMAPPPLYKEGIKAQTPWLYQFLRNPERVRQVTVLRMPHFNMSSDEAHALANYFAAVDGEPYPYQRIAQREPVYLRQQTRSLEQAGLLSSSDDYLSQSWKILNADLCIKCHSVGGRSFQRSSPTDVQGPNLDLAADRLRPDWTLLWLYNPGRVTPYTSMPQAFPHGRKTQFTQILGGDPGAQTVGLRDALMNYHHLMESEGKTVYRPKGATTTGAGSSGGGE